MKISKVILCTVTYITKHCCKEYTKYCYYQHFVRFPDKYAEFDVHISESAIVTAAHNQR